MKKLLVAITIFTIVIVTAVFSQAEEVSAEANVKLLKVTSNNYDSSTYKSSSRSAIVKVKDLGFEKKVKLHLKLKDGSWSDSVNGRFVQFAEEGYEIWRVDASRYSSDVDDIYNSEFVVKYVVNGETYWDNNNGQNYKVNTPGSDVFLGNGINVLTDYAYAYKAYYNNTVYFYGYIAVRNIAFNKEVDVTYSTDNWATTKVVKATYSYGPSASGIENWRFNVNNLPAETTEIEYAVSYKVNGNTYWDNNGGANYKIKINN